MLGDFRHERGVHRLKLEEEVQVADGLLLRDQAPETAATKECKIHKVPVRRRPAHAREMGHGDADSKGKSLHPWFPSSLGFVN